MIPARAALVTVSLASLLACTEDPPPGGGTGGSGTGGRPATGGMTATGGSGTGGTGTGGSATGGMVGSTGGSGTGGAGGTSGDVPAETPGETGEVGAETGGETATEVGGVDLAPGVSPMTSFFITSKTSDGNLGGIDGADKTCQDLAAAVGLGAKTWKAYLSTDTPKVDAKTRIGSGPWYNSKGTKIADSIDALHLAAADGSTAGNMINAANALTEKGMSAGPHDILTGTQVDGTLAAGQTCMNWMGGGTGRVGHYDRMGIMSNIAPRSWNSAHNNQGCVAGTIERGGGQGRFYCFATTP